MMKRTTAGLLAFLLSSSSLQSATLLPNGQQQFIDGNGKPYASGTVTFYSDFPTCSVLSNTWQNAEQTMLNTNPVVLDAAGRATIFGSGSYCQILKDYYGNTIWTKQTGETASTSSIGWGGTSGGTANAQTVTIPGFAKINGQTFYFVAGYTNTSNLTLSVNAGTLLAVVKTTTGGTSLLSGGEVAAGNVIGVTYYSTSGQLQLVTNNTQSYSGEVRTFAMGTCPSGWLPANGAPVSASIYSALYNAIGTTWGTSAGYVVLPDLRGVFVRGAGANAAVNLTAGGYPTGILGSYVSDTYLNHAHTVTDPGHAHSLSANSTGFATGAAGSVSRFESFGTQASPGNVAGNTYSNTTGISVNTSTTGGATETAPANASLLYCIKY